MNNWDTSPIGQTNEVARKFTPKDDGSPKDAKQKKDYEHRLAEDLQKIRRSNHSSHQPRDEIMDDDEHDGIIKGLLYPGLEDLDDDLDFFEDDYQMAQAAVRDVPPSRAQAFPSRSNDAYNEPARLTVEDSYYDSYFSSMGRPYSDLTNEKLSR
jgi:hypothetical protein